MSDNGVCDLHGVQGELHELGQAVDASWVLVCAFFVFFMTPGFIMLEYGAAGEDLEAASGEGHTSARSQMLIFKVLNTAYVAFAYVLVGHHIFNGSFMNWVEYLLRWDASAIEEGVAEDASWLYHYTFAVNAATICTGAVLGRLSHLGFLVSSLVIGGLIHPFFAMLTWAPPNTFSLTHYDYSRPGLSVSSQGCFGFSLPSPGLEPPGFNLMNPWQNGTYDCITENIHRAGHLGFIDMAGGVTVHVLGGLSSLICSGFLGRSRHLVFQKTDQYIAVLGTFILCFAWFGFNTGSAMGMTGNRYRAVAHVAAVCVLTGSAAALTIAHYDINMRYDLSIKGSAESQPQWLRIVFNMLTCRGNFQRSSRVASGIPHSGVDFSSHTKATTVISELRMASKTAEFKRARARVRERVNADHLWSYFADVVARRRRNFAQMAIAWNKAYVEATVQGYTIADTEVASPRSATSARDIAWLRVSVQQHPEYDAHKQVLIEARKRILQGFITAVNQEETNLKVKAEKTSHRELVKKERAEVDREIEKLSIVRTKLALIIRAEEGRAVNAWQLATVDGYEKLKVMDTKWEARDIFRRAADAGRTSGYDRSSSVTRSRRGTGPGVGAALGSDATGHPRASLITVRISIAWAAMLLSLVSKPDATADLVQPVSTVDEVQPDGKTTRVLDWCKDVATMVMAASAPTRRGSGSRAAPDAESGAARRETSQTATAEPVSTPHAGDVAEGSAVGGADEAKSDTDLPDSAGTISVEMKEVKDVVRPWLQGAFSHKRSDDLEKVRVRVDRELQDSKPQNAPCTAIGFAEAIVDCVSHFDKKSSRVMAYIVTVRLPDGRVEVFVMLLSTAKDEQDPLSRYSSVHASAWIFHYSHGSTEPLRAAVLAGQAVPLDGEVPVQGEYVRKIMSEMCSIEIPQESQVTLMYMRPRDNWKRVSKDVHEAHAAVSGERDAGGLADAGLLSLVDVDRGVGLVVGGPVSKKDKVRVWMHEQRVSKAHLEPDDFETLHGIGFRWSKHAFIVSTLEVLNGLVAGFVAATSCAHLLSYAWALVLGVFTALAYLGCQGLERKLGVEDTVSAFPVHFGGGFAGAAFVGILFFFDGVRNPGNKLTYLGTQLGDYYHRDFDNLKAEYHQSEIKSFSVMGVQLVGLVLYTLTMIVMLVVLYGSLALLNWLPNDQHLAAHQGADADAQGLRSAGAQQTQGWLVHCQDCRVRKRRVRQE